MSNYTALNKFQKQALVIELHNQGRTIRQIAEVVHMGFKDIADLIKKHSGEMDNSVDTPKKSKTARAFELFLQGKQSVEVAIELDMPADEVEELHVQYWRLSKLDELETLYHEARYSLTSRYMSFCFHLAKVALKQAITGKDGSIILIILRVDINHLKDLL
jgi:cytidylate kinase